MPALRTACLSGLFAVLVAANSCTPPDVVGVRGTLVVRVVSGNGQSASAGSELRDPLVAQVLDQYGTPVEGQIVNFHVTAGGGRVFGGAAITGDNGVVQERWTLGPVPGTPQRVEARAVDNNSGQPLIFAVFTATALSSELALAFTVEPASTAAGANITPAVEVTAFDAEGNTATTFTGNVTLTIGTNPSGGTLSGTRTVAAQAGVARFANLRIDRSGTGYTLIATSAGLTTVTSSAFNVTGAGGGGANFALRFFGTGTSDIDRVKIRIDDPSNSNPGPPADVGATDFTIEFWMRANAADNGAPAVGCGNNGNWMFGNMILDRDRYNDDRVFGLSMAGGRIVFGVTGNGTGRRTICGNRSVDDGLWHHVAVTRARATGALQLFVDGVLNASAANGPGGDISYPDNGVPGNYCGGPCTNTDPFLVIGAEKHDAGTPAFNGFIDELRLSNVLRYIGSFAPPTARFEPDANTVALYHFDAGSGDPILDSSGAPGGPSDGFRRLGGTPAGPLWVTSDAPTGTP
jgi:concanavalin A-like lectin/glucanase superfamily protein